MSYIFTGVQVSEDVAGAANTSRRAIRVATTAAITITTALNSGDIIDGVVLANNDRVLVKNQADTITNGIYVVGTTPIRTDDYSEGSSVGGTVLIITEGTTNADSMWLCASNPPNDVVGTNGLTFIQTTGTGIGYIVGPGSSTVNAVPRYNTSSGDSVANSGVLVDVSNNVTGIAAITTAGTATINSVVISTGNNITGVVGITASGAVNTGALGVTGNITVSGNVDGVDVSTIPTTFAGVATTKGDLLVYNGSAMARLAAGTNGQILIPDSTTTTGLTWTSIYKVIKSITTIQHTANSGVGGGSVSVATWNTRPLTTLTDSLGGTTLVASNGGLFITSNTLVIPAGNYYLDMNAAAFRVTATAPRIITLGLSQVTTITPNDASTLAQTGTGSYFDYNTTTVAYRFWFNVSGGNSAPASGGRTLASIAVLAADSAAIVAQKIAALIRPTIYAAISEYTATQVIINNTVQGLVTNASAGTSGFAISIQAGNSTSSTITQGLSGQTINNNNTSTLYSNLTAYITVAQTSIWRFQQYSGAIPSSNSTFALGYPVSLGTAELYANISITKYV